MGCDQSQDSGPKARPPIANNAAVKNGPKSMLPTPADITKKANIPQTPEPTKKLDDSLA